MLDPMADTGGTVDCAFCKIIRGEAPASLIQRWDDAIAIAPLNPVTSGHVLVLPTVHVDDFGENPAVSATVMKRVGELVHAARGGGGACNVITSVGEAATQTVKHLHVHLVPRRHGDGLALPWTGQLSGRGVEPPLLLRQARQSSVPCSHATSWHLC